MVCGSKKGHQRDRLFKRDLLTNSDSKVNIIGGGGGYVTELWLHGHHLGIFIHINSSATQIPLLGNPASLSTFTDQPKFRVCKVEL